MKKIGAVFFALALWASSVSAAELNAICDSQNRVIEINLTDERISADRKILFYAVNEEYSAGFDADVMKDGIIGFDENISENSKCNGKIVYGSNVEKGYYNIILSDYLSEDDSEIVPTEDRTVRIYISDLQETEEAIKEINEASSSSLSEQFSQYADVLSIDKSKLNSDTVSAFIAMKEKANFTSISQIQQLFEKAAIIGDIKTLSDEKLTDTFDKYSKELGLDNNADYKTYSNDITKMYQVIRKPVNVNDTALTDTVKYEVRTAVALTALNNGTRVTITDILNNYNDVFKLDLDNEYKRSDKTEINKALENKNFTSVDSVKKAFDDKISIIKSNEQKTIGGSGGGSGSSGSYTGGKKILPYDAKESTSDNNTGHKFNDINDALWSETAVNFLVEKNIISGYTDNTFKPNKAITREEFVKILVLAFDKYSTDYDYSFSDGNKEAWYADYVASAVNLGWVQGRENNVFGINENITRQDMAVIVSRAIGTEEQNSNNSVLFDDYDSISDYAINAVTDLSARAIINGMNDNKFCPLQTLTRAEAAQVIYNLLKER